MIRKLLLLSALAFATKAATAQVVMSVTGSYSQNFNTLATSGTNSWVNKATISDWFCNNTGTGTDYIANNGSISTGSRYSFGPASGAVTDRALGSLGSGNPAAGHFAYGTYLENTSSGTITDIKVGYRGEQWRRGGTTTASQTVKFYYKVVTTVPSDSTTVLTPNNNAGWTNVGALDFTSPNYTSATASNTDGNATANYVSFSPTSLSGINVPAGSYVIIKWDDPDHSGNDHGMAIDDVTISWTVPPSGCSGTPNGGTASAAPAAICEGASTVLTLTGATSITGITRQWQSSPDSSAWTNVPSGGTGTSYNASPSVTTYYRCLVTCTNGGLSAGSAGAKVTVDHPPVVTADPDPQTICATQPIILNVAATGSNLTYQWRRNGTNVSGNSANYLKNNAGTADTGNYDVIVHSGTCSDTSATAAVAVNPLGTTLPLTGANATYLQADGIAYTFTDGTCQPIASITDASGGNVLGNISATVTVDAGVQVHNTQPYVQRHYEIAPASNGTATVKIYILQSEFDAYNANAAGFPALPTGPADAPGIANIAVTAFHGLPGDGTTGPGGQYNGALRELIMPWNITTTWNATNNWWELSFPVTGFSGFFVHGNTNFPLQATLHQFSGRMTGNHTAQLDWTVNEAASGDRFAVEKSIDGRNFHTIAELGAGTGKQYSYADAAASAAVNHYRLRLYSNGAETLSRTIALHNGQMHHIAAAIIPNPAQGRAQLRITSAEAGDAHIRISDLTGRAVQGRVATLGGGTDIIDLDLSELAPGQYVVTIETAAGDRQVLRLSKL